MCWHRAMTSSHHQQQQQRSEARLGSAVCARSLMMMMMMMMSKKSAVCLMRCGDCCRVHVLPVSKRLTLKRPVMVRLFLTSIHWLHHDLRCCQSISMDDPPLPSIGPSLSTARGSGQRIFCTRFDLQASFSRRTGQPPGGLVMFGSAHKDGVWESYPAPRPGEMSLRSCLLTAHRNRYLETGTYYHLTSGRAHDKA